MLAGGFAMVESKKILKLSTQESCAKKEIGYVMANVAKVKTTDKITSTLGVHILLGVQHIVDI